jgi:hypothetical protein
LGDPPAPPSAPAPAHHTSFSVVGSRTTRLSFGERPVLSPERAANAPVSVSKVSFSCVSA